MRQYFANHPVIDYRGIKLRNLLLSARVVKNVLSNSTLLYPYTLEEGDTPTMIAFDYYGSVDYVWLVLLANNIIDPYTDWYKSQDQFHSYIIKKYGSIEQAQQTISYYRSNSDLSAPEVSVTTFQLSTPEEQGLVSPVYAYDAELSQNESKRNIVLIDKTYAPRISLELEKLLNQ